MLIFHSTRAGYQRSQTVLKKTPLWVLQKPADRNRQGLLPPLEVNQAINAWSFYTNSLRDRFILILPGQEVMFALLKLLWIMHWCKRSLVKALLFLFQAFWMNVGQFICVDFWNWACPLVCLYPFMAIAPLRALRNCLRCFNPCFKEDSSLSPTETSRPKSARIVTSIRSESSY